MSIKAVKVCDFVYLWIEESEIVVIEEFNDDLDDAESFYFNDKYEVIKSKFADKNVSSFWIDKKELHIFLA